MQKSVEYALKVQSLIGKIIDTQQPNIEAAINECYSAFRNDHDIFVFGASHAGIIAEEMFGRSGGLVLANPIFSPALMLNARPFPITSDLERLEGFGSILLRHSGIRDNDVLIIHSVSGRNAVALDMSIKAKEMNITTIAITNMDYSRQVKSRHSSHKNLYELADIVIDNCGEIGDAVVTMTPYDIKAGPTSTVAGATIINMISVGFAEKCTEDGIKPPIFVSGNMDTGTEWNSELLEEYQEHIHYL